MIITITHIRPVPLGGLTGRAVALADGLNCQDLTNTVAGLASVVGGGGSASTIPPALERRMGEQAANMKPQELCTILSALGR